MGWDQAARAIAAADYGLIGRRRALNVGLSSDGIQHRINEGTWSRLHAGVYTLDVSPPSWSGQVRGAVLASGPHALASHRTAAVLYGLDGISGRMLELTVPYSNQPMPEGVIVHRTRRVLPSDAVDGIPVTSVERTWLDLASLLPEVVLEKALMSALRLKLTTPDRIAETLVDQGGSGVRGVKRARRVLARTDDGVTGSPAEVETMRLIRGAPIPMPELQYRIVLLDGGNAFPDFCWPDRMRIVEVDGLDAHASADRLHADLARQNALMQMGWEIRRFSARAVRRDPKGVIAEIVDFVAG